MMGADLRRTPLWDRHRRSSGKMVGFAGWEMPVQFPTGPIEEHRIVREDAGLFDVSHMGRYWIGAASDSEDGGAPAHRFVQELITNDLDRIESGRLLYTPLCLESGGVIDDVTVYRFDSGCLLVVNASNRDAVREWIAPRVPSGVLFEDRSDALAQLALQGPGAQARFAPLVDGDLDALGYYHHGSFRVLGTP
ncbi:MAG: glycine cleavage system aminomethyltransferase GcvT, partial [Candidatus Eisenbacteria bacterium]|nr:glycine cleavage system aminomethyltransferase GcvT [Candidatus Latescibacterota bacterium]MBD3301748.1 glycine cleavage system aminomethyltransferase GcvT [Candidatus Eisenbacteria bacterium]